MMIKNNEFSKLFPRGTRLPLVDAIRDTLKVIDIKGLKQIIASNIMQLFLFRRLRKHFSTQREIVRLLLKGLYKMKYKSEVVFNST